MIDHLTGMIIDTELTHVRQAKNSADMERRGLDVILDRLGGECPLGPWRRSKSILSPVSSSYQDHAVALVAQGTDL